MDDDHVTKHSQSRTPDDGKWWKSNAASHPSAASSSCVWRMLEIGFAAKRASEPIATQIRKDAVEAYGAITIGPINAAAFRLSARIDSVVQGYRYSPCAASYKRFRFRSFSGVGHLISTDTSVRLCPWWPRLSIRPSHAPCRPAHESPTSGLNLGFRTAPGTRSSHPYEAPTVGAWYWT